ncbi:MAG: hypothetical protein HQL68_03690 [Magnetococcales bacterium]|nr:hypothetical protein [Magnetococcales bacterium]
MSTERSKQGGSGSARLKGVEAFKGVAMSLAANQKPIQKMQETLTPAFSDSQLVSRVVQTEIDDPWHVEDQVKKNIPERLEELAKEMTNKEKDKPELWSPLENFIKDKASKGTSTLSSGSEPQIIEEVAVMEPVTPIHPPGEQSTQHHPFVDQNNNSAAEVVLPLEVKSKRVEMAKFNHSRTIPVRRKSFSNSIGMPFSSTDSPDSQPSKTAFSSEKVNQEKSFSDKDTFSIPATSKPTTATRPFSNQENRSQEISSPAVKEGLAVVEEMSQTDDRDHPHRVKTVIALAQATIKRKQAMHRSDSLLAAFSGEKLPPPDMPTYHSQANVAAAPVRNNGAAKKKHSSEKLPTSSTWQAKPVAYDISTEDGKTGTWHLEKSIKVPNIPKDAPEADNSKAGQVTQKDVSPISATASSGPAISARLVQNEQKKQVRVGEVLDPDSTDIGEVEFWEVPVETLGAGIVQVLGDTVGGVVHFGQAVAGGKNKGTITPSSVVSKTAINENELVKYKQGQRIKAQMAGKVGSGIKSIFSGVGMLTRGGVNIVVGSLGCLGGALVCLSTTIVGSNETQKQTKLTNTQKVEENDRLPG